MVLELQQPPYDQEVNLGRTAEMLAQWTLTSAKTPGANLLQASLNEEQTWVLPLGLSAGVCYRNWLVSGLLGGLDGCVCTCKYKGEGKFQKRNHWKPRHGARKCGICDGHSEQFDLTVMLVSQLGFFLSHVPDISTSKWPTGKQMSQLAPK